MAFQSGAFQSGAFQIVGGTDVAGPEIGGGGYVSKKRWQVIDGDKSYYFNTAEAAYEYLYGEQKPKVTKKVKKAIKTGVLYQGQPIANVTVKDTSGDEIFLLQQELIKDLEKAIELQIKANERYEQDAIALLLLAS